MDRQKQSKIEVVVRPPKWREKKNEEKKKRKEKRKRKRKKDENERKKAEGRKKDDRRKKKEERNLLNSCVENQNDQPSELNYMYFKANKIEKEIMIKN